MFKKMIVTSVLARAYIGEKTGAGEPITAKQFAEMPGSKLTITGTLVHEDGTEDDTRSQIVIRNSEVGAIKGAFFKALERGKGILEGEFTNKREGDNGTVYYLPHVDLKLTDEDGNKAFSFKPEAIPNWLPPEFGEAKVTALNIGTDAETQAAFKELVKENNAKRRA